jgi:ACS family glucarate transporter-like MFS transporter
MAAPGRVRYSIVAMALAINMLCYTDRVCIAVAGPSIRKEFGFSPGQMGLVFSIFSLAYAAGQAPWGMLADRYGSRGIVTAAIVCWSGFTALTGAAWNFVSMLAIRFGFGGIEAALSPATAVAFQRWTPLRERSTSFGAYLSGGRFGAALTPPLAAFLMIRFGWRMMFAIFGSLGIGAAAAWFFWYRDDPAQHGWVGAEEREVLRTGMGTETAPVERPRWGELLRSSQLRCLAGTAFAGTFLWQFYITWFPTYLIDQRHLPLREASFYAGLPFLFGFAATWIGGIASDFLTRRYDARRGRLWIGSVGLTMAGGLMLAGMLWPSPRAGALLMAGGAGAADLYLGAAWSAAVAIGGRSGGAVAGLMNASSNFAGFASPALIGWALQGGKSWNTILMAGVLSAFVAAFLWTGANAEQK